MPLGPKKSPQEKNYRTHNPLKLFNNFSPGCKENKIIFSVTLRRSEEKVHLGKV